VGYENRHRHARQQGSADPTKNHFLQPRVAIKTHNYKIAVVIRRARQDHVTNIGIGSHFKLDGDVDAMSGEPSRNVSARLGSMSPPSLPSLHN